MGDDWLISVPQKQYYSNFTSFMNASATTLFEGGGAYNMKLCTLVEMETFVGLMATYSSWLYGEDWITFGVKWRRVGNKMDGVLGRIYASNVQAQNTAASVTDNTTGLTTQLASLDNGGFKLGSKGIDAAITQSVRV